MEKEEDVFLAAAKLGAIEPKEFPVTVLLIDDQKIIAEAIKKMLAEEKDIVFHYCPDATEAIRVANEVKPTVILQDLVMPDIDGLTLVRYFRANSSTRETPLIVLSVKEDPKIKAEAFALGANDYAVKLPDKHEFIARIRYHSAAYTRLLERNLAYEKLEASQQLLKNELAEASRYVRSLLPDPIDNGITAQWQFIPSMLLGGDAFGYHWIDDNHFALYLLDVCGHGVGAALLSSSAITAIRGEALPFVNFLDPSSVLTGLNSAFPMEKHHNMFFTIWYGVYNTEERTLIYSSGGHPPALLFSGDTPKQMSCYELTTPGLVIGGMEDTLFKNASCAIGSCNRLYLFSDGVFELTKSNGSVMTFKEFTAFLTELQERIIEIDPLQTVVNSAYTVTNGRPFADDYSIVEFIFKS